ncbi:thiamine diphosphokinase [Pararhizobium mangrovi]|uniref:Thiamine diphosphokinase n=1 Tax=Pararhizobium mangrovi TaxID=2590452 RepID=A0A506UB21_9HYPH|nr:thiamine diphosphokinase [Pararhizobium mangrovi]TPW30728.1 thiamine diphosphokinase [Pararhizobium mangrovi]
MNARLPFLVLLGGPLTVTPAFRARVAGWRSVAADSGMRHAEVLGVTPELWIGDFDSASPDLSAAWPDVERQSFATAKNETDGELAVRAAIERGAGDLVLAGGLGGDRSDHALLHCVLACRLRAEGWNVELTSGREDAVALSPGRIEVPLTAGTVFSIVGFSELNGLTIDGARFPLDDYTLPFGSSRTISNKALGPVAITLRSGTALLVTRPDPNDKG